MSSRRPVSARPIQDTEALIDHLIPMLKNLLANDVSNVYFGDIGVYLPSHFQGPRKENRAVLAINPAFDRLEEGTRVSSQETRLIGVDIIGFVNITPDFKASPSEAYGERRLSQIMNKIRTFLTQRENATLGGRVGELFVGDVAWRWMQRDNLSLRGAALEVTVRVKISRMQT